MNWWNEFADQMECEVPLAKMTWFRLGGRARYLFRPHDTQQLSTFIRRARNEDVSVKVLGRGANVLIRDDGFDGVVVRLDAKSFRSVRRANDGLEVGAGVDLMPLSRACSRRGLRGLEFLAGIPATVGGAVRMNAGGRSGEFGDIVTDVCFVTSAGEIEHRTHEQIGFAYRRTELPDGVVTSAKLRLRKDDPWKVNQCYREVLAAKQKTQPLSEPSAGCIFKNPTGASAGALIDRAGLKGTSVGLARVSERHANFIVADNGARADDVLRLIDLVRERVRQACGTQLETEIDIW